MAKIFEISLDKGETAEVPLEQIAQENGTLGAGSIDSILDLHPDAVNARIVFQVGMDTFDEYEGIAFPLDRAVKTLGTYITKANKLLEGVDPKSRETRGASSSSSAKANVGIEQLDSETVRLFEVDGDAEATVEANGSVETNDFSTMSYFIEGLLSPYKWSNRLAKLRQFTGGEEAVPPQYMLIFDGHRVSLGDNEPSEKAVLDAKGKIAKDLIIAGETFDPIELQSAQAEMLGGGSEWLDSWVEYNFPQEAEA